MGSGEEQATSTGLSLFCWGSGQFGQHGHAVEDAIEFRDSSVSRFTGRVKMVGCGASHTVVVTDTNDVFAWGNGQNGQLGCGDTRQRLSPVRMKVRSAAGLSESPEIVAVACGDRHTFLLLHDGRILCCGSNFYAQLSFDLMQPQYRKDLVIPTLLPLTQRVLQVACGQHHTVLLYDGGEVACFGRNMYGQIGMPSDDARNDCFEKPRTLTGAFGRSSIIKIAAGDDGNVYCWGYGRACGLRQGHMMSPSKLSSGLHATAVDGGCSHSVLLTDAGQLWAVGSNAEGQCGTGPDQLFLPNLCLVAPETLGDRISLMACGENFTLASGAAGVFVWGKNSHVIGPGDAGSRFFWPVPLTTVDCELCALSAGSWHAAALLTAVPKPLSIPSEIPEAAAPTGSSEIPETIDLGGPHVGMQRERTYITIAELYAPTPTPRGPVLSSSDEDDDNDDEDGSNDFLRSELTPKPSALKNEIVPTENCASSPHDCKSFCDPFVAFSDLLPPSASIRPSSATSFLLPTSSPTSPPPLSPSPHCSLSPPLSNPASGPSSPPNYSLPHASVFSPSIPAPLQPNGHTGNLHEALTPPTLSLGPIRIPSPPAGPRPPLRAALRRESLNPLQLGAIANRSVTEDLIVLRPAARRTAEERPALSRRELTRPLMMRERILMVPRTLTFVLNDKKEVVTSERINVGEAPGRRTLPKQPTHPRLALRRAKTTLSRPT